MLVLDTVRIPNGRLYWSISPVVEVKVTCCKNFEFFIKKKSLHVFKTEKNKKKTEKELSMLKVFCFIILHESQDEIHHLFD